MELSWIQNLPEVGSDLLAEARDLDLAEQELREQRETILRQVRIFWTAGEIRHAQAIAKAEGRA